jgi:hypothetical protein
MNQQASLGLPLDQFEKEANRVQPFVGRHSFDACQAK